MKKIAAFILSVAVFVASFSVCLNVYGAKTNDVSKTRIEESNTYYEFDASTKTLTLSGSGDIPNMINNASSQPWFDWRSDGSIENIVVEEGITRIGNYVLYQVCAPNISLPSTLGSIGNYSLAYNNLIEHYELPFGVKSIGASAFENCVAMKSVFIPDSVATIGKNAFKQCYKLENVFIPHSVSSVGNNAFYRCSELSSVNFESLSSPVKIGSYAFQTCPKLKEISIPLNATMGTYSYGYDDNKKLYNDVLMKLYSGSDAMAYAKSRSIPYSLLNTIPLSLGAKNKNEYIEETMFYEYNYSFTPDITQKYNFYSEGEVDLRAVLSDENGEIAQGDDISADNLNFFISAELEAGREYLLTVNSVKSIGEYSVVVYPDEIVSFEIKGELSFNADEGENGYFEISDEMLEGFVLTVNFGGGFQDIIYYENMLFDNRSIALADRQKEQPFTCGDNNSYIAIGEVESAFNVNIQHSYSSKIVEMTLDDDGYTLYTCILCGDNYKADFIPTTAVTVCGKAVLAEHPNGSHEHNIPYKYAKFYANDRYYYIDEYGNWSLRTFDSLDLTFENEYGRDVEVHIDVNGENVDIGEIAFEGYDFNSDGRVNAKDFAIFLKQKQQTFGESYWDYAYNFL